MEMKEGKEMRRMEGREDMGSEGKGRERMKRRIGEKK